MRRRRRILSAAILGFVTTVLIAWGCSLWVSLSGANELGPAPEDLVALVPDDWTRPPPEERLQDFDYSAKGWHAAARGVSVETWSPTVEWTPASVASVETWKPTVTWTVAQEGWKEHVEPGRVRMVRAGWPLLCLRTARVDSRGIRELVLPNPITGRTDPFGPPPMQQTNYGSWVCEIRWGIEPPAWLERTMARNLLVEYEGFLPNDLPLRPQLGGFVIDWMLYSVLWLLPLWLVGAARRSLRRRGGRCPTCGYDRRGLAHDAACPECGMTPASAFLPHSGQGVSAPTRPLRS